MGTTFLSEALTLAAEQPVLPLEPRGKRPLAGLGLRHATQDADTLTRWWRRWPEANVGLRCDGLLVVDVDGETGEESLTRLEQHFGRLPASRVVSTGKGRHLYFRSPTLVGNSTAGIGKPEGIDLRGGTRGFVVAPPSIHATGRRYTWENDCPILGLPESWLNPLTAITVVPAAPAVETTTDTAYGRAALETELERLLGAQPGRRNEELNLATFRLAQLVAGGQLSRASVETSVERYAALLGLGPFEVRSTVRSAMRSGLRFPRLPRARVRTRK